jgi:ParB/RepB/Spo0J family partition protein
LSPDTSPIRVDPQTLKPHPRYRKIYGEDEDISQLVESIRTSGWWRPLLVTPKRTIVSGHRRWRAALELGLDWVPVEVRAFPHRMAELETLLVENSSRFKTREQKVREANSWKEIEADKAKRRQTAGVQID